MEENLLKEFRWTQVALFASIMVILALICMVVYSIGENQKLKQENIKYCEIIENRYDINRDGSVDVTDTLEMVDYILEHNEK